MHLIIASLLLALASSHAQTAPLPVPPIPAIAAKAYLLLDFNSGKRLAEQNPQMRIDPASLTKLMTAYLTFAALKQERIRPHQQVPVSVKAWRTIGSRMFIEPRNPVTVKQLMNGMIVQSGNDASIALAEAVAGSEEVFVQLMNREAQRLGLKNTHFVNATGLPHAEHYSTTEDLALLAAAIIRDFPQYYPLYSQKEFTYNKIKQANRNRLLWTDPTVDGMKTGYTKNAGYCLITSAKRGEHRLLSVVLGAASEARRAAESRKLLNYGFQFYDSFRVHAKQQPVATLKVFKGAADTVKAGFLTDLYVTLPKGQRSKLTAAVESLQPLLAPINVGQQVGTMKVMLDGKPYRKLAVVALENVPLAGILGRSWDSLRLLFH
ncbi:MAG: D-alanyl-D-alanine carboxypeptidase [Betaproteobacteria bacterium]|nr:D-alanyl-D-alanine carboxypeptidase [Betaproteobacteria bacterium]MDH3438007.1 D-alanyl-D-alanine carboxypeptidase [Betaproteobacteria bacterium]